MRDNCDYSLKELWALSERALGPENCNTTLLRKYARTSWRWMGAYEKGLKGVQAAWAVRLCSKHRGISKVVDDKMNADA
jgi:Txe/YoeB family toxin of Txe-Axe toxin-antitoxin module